MSWPKHYDLNLAQVEKNETSSPYEVSLPLAGLQWFAFLTILWESVPVFQLSQDFGHFQDTSMSCKMRHMECIQGDPAACLLSRQVANQKLIVRTGLQSVWESFCCWCCHHSCTWQLPTYNPWTACDSPNFRDQLGPVSRPNEAVLLPWTSLNQRRTFSSAVLPIPLMFTWQLSLHTREVSCASGKLAGGRNGATKPKVTVGLAF